MSIFDTSKIKQSDRYRNTKKNYLVELKDYLQGIDREIKLEILEKHLPSIINMYVLTHQKEDLTMRELTAKNLGFKDNWHEKLVNNDDLRKAKHIKLVVIKAIMKFGGALTKELKKMKVVAKNKNLQQFDAEFPFSVNNGIWAKETARQILRDVCVETIGNGESKIPKIENRFKEWHDRKFKAITDNLREAKFYRDSRGRDRVIDSSGFEHDIESFRSNMKGMITHGYEESENGSRLEPLLKDEWLPLRQKKADLLRKVEEVIANGIKEIERNKNASQSTTTANAADNTNDTNNDKVNETTTTTSDSETSGDTSDDDTEVSSIFSEDQPEDSDSDNSSVNSSFSDNNEKPTENSDSSSKKASIIRKEKDMAFIRVENSLNREPVVKEEELDEENRGWLKKIEEATSVKEIYSIETKINLDIKNKRNLKKKTAELDTILEETVDARNFSEHFQTAQRSLGESELQVKAERAKKRLIENDPEVYFNTFNNWVKEEEQKLEKELEEKKQELEKELKESKTISELEYNEEEKQFLAGQITDRQKQEEIAQQIEVKINVKKKYWNIIKWIKEKTKWLKTKAKLLKKNNKVGFEKKVEQIKQEIKNAENNSNLHAQQAFKHAKNKAEALLRDLENVSNETINNTTDKNKFPTGWVVGIGALIVVPVLVAGVIIRQRRMKVRRKGQK